MRGLLAAALLAGAGCQPTQPVREVRDPFGAPLPGAAEVQTAPLGAPGLAAPGPITEAAPVGDRGPAYGDPFEVGTTALPEGGQQIPQGTAEPLPAETGSAGDTGFSVAGAAAALDAADGAAGDDGTVIEVGVGGMLERLPDTCQLDDYRQFQGQPASAATAVITERPTRVIAPDAIVSQEYDPRRVNFYVDGTGRVTRIICG